MDGLHSTMPPIGEFYSGKRILVTGGTGFVGKVLVEKLLRCCPDLSNIYLLMRSKRNKSVNERLQEYIAGKAFEKVRNKDPSTMNKIIPISADLCLANLGLSEEDVETLKNNVDIIFHSAATIKFNEHLKKAIHLNTRATYKLLQIAREMPKLVAFIHVSTAYSNCDRKEVDEKIYPLDVDPLKLMDTVEWMDDKMVETITPAIMGQRPNTYTLTKAMAETILEQKKKHVPVVIVRPSIITGAWKDPVPGWVDNFASFNGIVVAYCKGVLRTAQVKLDGICDIIPVDVCANLLIAASWHCALTRPKDVVVYNSTSGTVNPFRWKDLYLMVPVIQKYPSESFYRCPGGKFRENAWTNFMFQYLDHYIPAFFVDLFSTVTRVKLFPHGLTALEAYRRCDKAIDVLQHFAVNEWIFHNENSLNVSRCMTPADSQQFNFSVKDLDWKDYSAAYYLGIKQYVFNEDLKNLPKARRYYKIRYAMGCSFQIALIVCILGLLANYSTSFNDLMESMLDIFTAISSSLL